MGVPLRLRPTAGGTVPGAVTGGVRRLETTQTVAEITGHTDRAGPAEGPPGLALVVDLASALVTQFEMGICPDLPGLRQPAVDVRGGGLGRQVIGGQERPARPRRSRPVGDLSRGLPGELELGGAVASGLTSFHHSTSCPGAVHATTTPSR